MTLLAPAASSRFVVACRARVGAPLARPSRAQMDAPSALCRSRAGAVLRRCDGARIFCRRRLPPDPRTSAAAARAPPAARRGSSARLSVVAKSSKRLVGRFPHVPSTDAHPIVRDGLDLGELCATWRAGAARPAPPSSATWRRPMMEAPAPAAESSAARRPPLGRRLVGPAGARSIAPPPLVLAPPSLSQARELNNAYALEVRRGVARKLRAVRRPLGDPQPRPPRPPRPPRCGLRAVVDGGSRARRSSFHRARRGASGERHVRRPDVPAALYHDVVARLSDRGRPSGPEVYEMRRRGERLLARVRARRGRRGSRARTRTIRGRRKRFNQNARFVVIECAKAVRVRARDDAPPRVGGDKATPSSETRAPSAGTQTPPSPPRRANAVLDRRPPAHADATRSTRDETMRRRSDASSSKEREIPLALGAILRSAASGAGRASRGVDDGRGVGRRRVAHARTAENARGNLAAFRAHMPAQHAQAGAIGAAPADAHTNRERR